MGSENLMPSTPWLYKGYMTLCAVSLYYEARVFERCATDHISHYLLGSLARSHLRHKASTSEHDQSDNMGNLFSIFAKRDGSMTIGGQWLTDNIIAISIDLIDENKFYVILVFVSHKDALENCSLESCADVFLRELDPKAVDVTSVDNDYRKSFDLFPMYKNVPQNILDDFCQKAMME